MSLVRLHSHIGFLIGAGVLASSSTNTVSAQSFQLVVFVAALTAVAAITATISSVTHCETELWYTTYVGLPVLLPIASLFGSSRPAASHSTLLHTVCTFSLYGCLDTGFFW